MIIIRRCELRLFATPPIKCVRLATQWTRKSLVCKSTYDSKQSRQSQLAFICRQWSRHAVFFWLSDRLPFMQSAVLHSHCVCGSISALAGGVRCESGPGVGADSTPFITHTNTVCCQLQTQLSATCILSMHSERLDPNQHYGSIFMKTPFMAPPPIIFFIKKYRNTPRGGGGDLEAKFIFLPITDPSWETGFVLVDDHYLSIGRLEMLTARMRTWQFARRRSPTNSNQTSDDTHTHSAACAVHKQTLINHQPHTKPEKKIMTNSILPSRAVADTLRYLIPQMETLWINKKLLCFFGYHP